jgi:hypothetical protein
LGVTDLRYVKVVGATPMAAHNDGILVFPRNRTFCLICQSDKFNSWHGPQSSNSYQVRSINSKLGRFDKKPDNLFSDSDICLIHCYCLGFLLR